MLCTQRIRPEKEPFGIDDEGAFRWGAWDWPASWIRPAGIAPGEPVVFAAVLEVDFVEGAELRLHVAGDQRWELLVDGIPIGRDAEASAIEHWAYATFELRVSPGRHRFAARIWCAGGQSGVAHPTWQAGLLVAAEGGFGRLLSTGVAPWRVRRMPGWRFVRPPQLIIAAARVDVDCAGVPPDWTGPGDGWEEPEVGIAGQARFHTDCRPGHVLARPQLPAQRERSIAWGLVRHADHATGGGFAGHQRDPVLESAAQGWLDGGTLDVAPHQCVRVLVDLGRISCVYARLSVHGGAGADVRLEAADALIIKAPSGDPARWWEAGKGQRDEISDKWWWGGGDRWLLDGRDRLLEAPWWQAGRYLLFIVTTGATPLRLARADLIETGYPLDPAGSAACSHPAWNDIERLCWRSMQVNAHEHWMDCPTVERLQYIGDTRVVGLVALTCTRDTALHRKAILDFDRSRDAYGLPSSRSPTRWRQTIPAFAAPFVGLVHDHWMWRGDEDFVRERLSGVRAVLDRICAVRDQQGLLPGHPGWNFTDWCESWDRNSGIPPAGNREVMGVYNWFAVLALGWAAELEAGLGEPELAVLRRRQRAELVGALLRTTWDASRGRLRDAPGSDGASEHVQALALLADVLPSGQKARVLDALVTQQDLARCTIYFEHYLFAALAAQDRSEAILARWQRWSDMPALGLTACPEMPEPSRSDCHGWGAHPLYHLRCSLAGVQPAAPGLAAVRIRPRPGGLERIVVDVPHPGGGAIHVDCGPSHGRAVLPDGVAGFLDLPGVQPKSFAKEVAW